MNIYNHDTLKLWKETAKTADRMDQWKRLFTLQTIPSSLQLYVWRHNNQQHDESKLSFFFVVVAT